MKQVALNIFTITKLAKGKQILLAIIKTVSVIIAGERNLLNKKSFSLRLVGPPNSIRTSEGNLADFLEAEFPFGRGGPGRG